MKIRNLNKQLTWIAFKTHKIFLHGQFFFTCLLFLFAVNLSVGQVIIDSCFMSPSPGTSFSSTTNLTGNNSDLLSWTGSSWTGGWPAANLTIPPPNNGVGCRAIFIGNGQTWTTGGEGFGLRFTPALVSGQTYTFNITYVSHGTGSTGSFSPFFYTNSNGSLSGAVLVGNLTPVGYSWTTNPITFTATAAQAGHTWIYIFSGSSGSSGLINNFCPSCNTTCNPTFNPVGPYCAGASIPALPTTSTNGIPGTWSPAINNTTTTNYTFTPSNGCATTTSLTITINPNVTPTFTPLGPYCAGATPAILPGTSTNSISGTWNPATISTATAGTSTYTFTPTAGQCAATTTMNVTVNAATTPSFTALGPYCVGATPGTLPGTSTNGITGTWSPAAINTTTAGTSTYTFTPAAGQCATTTTMIVTVSSGITPTFTTLGPYCAGAAPGTLPGTSTNGITGTWSPASINTATAGTNTYTFTPTAGQCAISTTMNVTVNANTTPDFTALGPYCVGATPGTLPGTSTNGITGTWSPATINTATAGTSTYTFTPTSGQCATTTTMSVTVSTGITPAFTALGPYCVGATPETLPNTSTNGISGTWTPASISTATAGTSTYTFTPTSGQCATTTTMDVTVNPNITPSFTALGPYCVGATPGTLPGTSNNGITGTWSPATINTAAAGTGTYTFTPEPTGQCTLPVTMNIVISVAADIHASTTQANICFGSSTQIYAGGATNFVWQPGNISGSYISVSPSNTTTYTVTGQLNGCTGSDTITVHVFPYPVITFDADRKEGCEDLLVQFTDQSNFDDASWYWEFGDYTFSYEHNPLHYFYDPGVFDVSLTMTTIYGCSSTFLWSDMITVYKSPEAEFVSVPEFPSELSPTVWFYDRSFAASAWEWDFGDYNALINNSNEQNPIHQYSDTGYFDVMLIALTPMGCADTTRHTVYIAPEMAFFIPNAFTPNEDDKNSSFICKGNGIRWETFEMRIYDRWGKQLLYTQDALAGWNGKYKGAVMPQDVYVWLISFVDVCLQKHDLKGTVTLIK
ncbi:MAG TPA: PKD domain-containing protein [Bacteroidales bacterium]|nr:PKD domain-containing protein [Bacteroidales bacterium]